MSLETWRPLCAVFWCDDISEFISWLCGDSGNIFLFILRQFSYSLIRYLKLTIVNYLYTRHLTHRGYYLYNITFLRQRNSPYFIECIFICCKIFKISSNYFPKTYWQSRDKTSSINFLCTGGRGRFSRTVTDFSL
jgi:hypothetical protein